MVRVSFEAGNYEQNEFERRNFRNCRPGAVAWFRSRITVIPIRGVSAAHPFYVYFNAQILPSLKISHSISNITDAFGI